MKVNIFLSVVSIAIASLIGYLYLYTVAGQEYSIICGVGSTFSFAGTLLPIIGIHYEHGRLGINLKLISSIFFVIFLVTHFYFAISGIKIPYYIITNGIILGVYLISFYKVSQTKDT